MGNGNMEYVYKVGDIVNGLKILELTRHGKQNRKAYIVESTTYKTADPFIIIETDFKKGYGDPYVSGRRTCLENSLYSVEWVRPYLVDVEKAKKSSKFSNALTKFKCPNCDKVKKMKSSNLLNQGFSCENCSKNIPYPELLFLAYNKTKNLGFVSQVRDLYKGHIFDFVNYEKRIIVETHGMQHYKEDVHWGSMNAYEKTSLSDMNKRKWCKRNNYTLIELDCRKSDFEFITHNINKSILPNVEESEINDILQLIEYEGKYDIKNIIYLYSEVKKLPHEIGVIHNCSVTTIRNILAKNNIDTRSKEKQVRCITTGVIYKSVKEAAELTGTHSSQVSQACNGKVKSSGKDKHGNKLYWEWKL